MSNDTNLPPCRLCGQTPHYHLSADTWCDSTACVLYRLPMSFDDWRRLHGPRLAPEHVEALRAIAERIEWHGLVQTAAELRAALAAMGEDGR